MTKFLVWMLSQIEFPWQQKSFLSRHHFCSLGVVFQEKGNTKLRSAWLMLKFPSSNWGHISICQCFRPLWANISVTVNRTFLQPWLPWLEHQKYLRKYEVNLCDKESLIHNARCRFTILFYLMIPAHLSSSSHIKFNVGGRQRGPAFETVKGGEKVY